MKKILAALLASSMVLTAFAGCNKDNGTGEDKSLQKVIDSGKLVMGLDDSFPPMGYRDENNEIVGFDIDCAKEVASRLGVELVVQPISWDSKEQELNTGNIDCIWNGMSVDDDRKAAMNLSEPYMNNRMILMVLGDSAIQSKDELAGKKIGVQSGSTAQKIFEGSEFYNSIGKDNLIGFKDNVTACMDLEMGGIEALFLDEVVAYSFIVLNGKDYRLLDDGTLTDEAEEYAIGFRKNDQALRDAVQGKLSEMKADGTLAEISEKWFSKDVTIVK